MTLSGHKPPLTTEQSLRTSQRLEGTSVVVAVHGEIDLCSATHLHARLVTALDTATATSGCVVVDLRGVEFLGAAGLAVLAETLHRAEARGTRLRIVADDSCPASRVLPIAHLDHALAPGSRPTP
jgi:anti-sigma B factor antagonist